MGLSNWVDEAPFRVPRTRMGGWTWAELLSGSEEMSGPAEAPSTHKVECAGESHTCSCTQRSKGTFRIEMPHVEGLQVVRTDETPAAVQERWPGQGGAPRAWAGEGATGG